VRELSQEKRVLIASALALVVITVWTIFLKPPAPPQPVPQTASQQAAQTLSSAGPGTAPTQPGAKAAAPKASQEPSTVAPRAATQEQTIVVENGLYRVEISNRGAVVRSWQLKKYKDDAKPPRTLDLVHPDAAPQFGWPFSLTLDDGQLEKAANEGLYQVTPAGGTLQAPAEVTLEWSDGHLAVSKRLKFDRSYLVEVETGVTLDGKPLAHGVAWRGGFGDTTVYNKAALQVQVFYSAGGKLQSVAYNKTGTPGAPATPLHRPGTFDYAGIEDHYFVAAFLPRAAGAGYLTLTDWMLERDVVQDGKPAKEPVVEMAAGSNAAGALQLRVFVGPKDFDELKKIQPPLTALVQFGWLEFIALPLFYLLRWLHGYVPNYGWAIILLTVLINMVLFPLKMKSWRSMQRMQKVAPEIKAIQERYKKYSMRDPKKQEMNKEIMDLYAREGINPMGGCLPMVLQMPIWFGLYRMLGVTLELRHAAWLGWIRDLSAPDPYYILPIIMGITMYTMQKMTPMTSADPSQQRMMTMMPLLFGGMFVIFPVSSGLVLYILSSNLVGMAQQWYLNRTAPPDLQPSRGRSGKKK
jgi:YidC/Oxa1 family membrane protein insertase